MIKAAFMDIDDTLLDFQAFVRQTMRDGFARFGLPAYEERMYPVFHQVNARLWERIERGEITRADLLDLRWPVIFDELGFTGDGRAFEHYFKDALLHSAIPVEGAEDLVPWLAERYILCAASNGPYAQQETRLTIAGWLPYFRHLFISEEIGAQKPTPAFFDTAMRRLNASLMPGHSGPVLPGEVIMVGDSLTSDMAGGRNAGMVTCLLDTSGHAQPDDRVDHRISKLDELKTLLGRI